MHFKVFCVLVVGVFVQKSSGSINDKVHLRFHVPQYNNHHRHTKVVYLKDKSAHDHDHNLKESYDFYKPPPNKAKISNSVNNLPNFGPALDDGYKQSWKTMRSEKYETETIDNPHSDNPDNKYIVKTKYKVREKLPYEETTVGYDQEYEYPLSEFEQDYQKNAKLVDDSSVKNDPFPEHYYSDIHQLKNQGTKSNVKEKKPKTFYYRYPDNDYEYFKNVHLVDYYLAKTQDLPYGEGNVKTEKNDVEYEYSPISENYEKSRYGDHGPSDEYDYQKYKNNGPSFDHLDEYGDHSSYNKRKAPTKKNV